MWIIYFNWRVPWFGFFKSPREEEVKMIIDLTEQEKMLLNSALRQVQFSNEPIVVTLLRRGDGTFLIAVGGARVSSLDTAAEHRRDRSYAAHPEYKILEKDEYEFGNGLHLVELRVYPTRQQHELMFLTFATNGRQELKWKYSDGRVQIV